MFWEYASALVAGLVALSPAEWKVHKKLLHAPKKERTWYNRASSYAHHDVHHAAFMGPAHYYRDITNEHEVIHFSPRDVGVILGIGGIAGFLGHKVYDLTQGRVALNEGDLAATAGFTTAAAIGYLGYELTHHYMHVIGKRRLAINRTLGDLLQEQRDGKLRFTKPLLDDICNAIEENVDANVKGSIWPVRYNRTLEDRFNEQVERNRTELGNEIKNIPFNVLMEQIAYEMTDREREVRTDLTTKWQRFKYACGRKTQKTFRGSGKIIGWYLKRIDNHHFVHHYNYTKNLNVFLIWADHLFGTKMDSSVKTLDTWHKKHLLCPNSPDEEPFVRPPET